MKKIELRSCYVNELEDLSEELGEKRFRGKQIFQWVNKGIKEFKEMTNLPNKFIDQLKMVSYIDNLEILEVLTSKIDGTKKYLLSLRDGNVIECVLMRYKHGNTVCVSTQVGCKMGCSFCASTIGGVVRNLTSGEILGQILEIKNNIKEPISNVVLMGSGEPLDNYSEVLKFLDLVNNDLGLNIGMRNITISTCGIPSRILDLAKKQFQLTLAISLHAPNDELRSKIMPINKVYNIKKLINSCKEYIKSTNRRITFEYALIKGVNDSRENAYELSHLLKGMLCHVNLIPLNKVKERDYISSEENTVVMFRNILIKNGIDVTIRRELGSDIQAACGQLRKDYIDRNRA